MPNIHTPRGLGKRASQEEDVVAVLAFWARAAHHTVRLPGNIDTTSWRSEHRAQESVAFVLVVLGHPRCDVAAFFSLCPGNPTLAFLAFFGPHLARCSDPKGARDRKLRPSRFLWRKSSFLEGET